MTYYVDDTRTLTSAAVEVEAKTPLEAARKTFPQNVIERDYTGVGDIVVWRKSGRGSYVYNIRLQNNKRKDRIV